MKAHARATEAQNVTIIGAIINSLLGVIKLLGGALFYSHALIADGVHSLADLVADAMVFFASKYGSQDADADHPYGHQRIETAATLMLSLLLLFAGFGIAWDSFRDIMSGIHHTPQWFTIPIAILSIIANEWSYLYTRRVGLRIKSDLIIANAWHHRADALASVVVLMGLVGSLVGFVFLDAIAAIIVAIMVAKLGFTYGLNSIKELIDTAVEPTVISSIEKIIHQVEGVIKIHQLRTRSMGQDIFVDVHIQVSPFISVSEGHYTAQHVHRKLIASLPHIKDVTVHVDPEDDETISPSHTLPSRKTIEQNLLLAWKEQYPAIDSWILHYIDGQLIIDLLCTGPVPELQKHLAEDLYNQPVKVNFLFIWPKSE